MGKPILDFAAPRRNGTGIHDPLERPINKRSLRTSRPIAHGKPRTEPVYQAVLKTRRNPSQSVLDYPRFLRPAGKVLVAAAACLLNAAVSRAQDFPAMEFVIPLYIAPLLNNGTLGEILIIYSSTVVT